MFVSAKVMLSVIFTSQCIRFRELILLTKDFHRAMYITFIYVTFLLGLIFFLCRTYHIFATKTNYLLKGNFLIKMYSVLLRKLDVKLDMKIMLTILWQIKDFIIIIINKIITKDEIWTKFRIIYISKMLIIFTEDRLIQLVNSVSLLNTNTIVCVALFLISLHYHKLRCWSKNSIACEVSLD